MSRAKRGRLLSATLTLCLLTGCAAGTLDEGAPPTQENGPGSGYEFGGDAEHFVRDESGVYLCVLRRPTDLADLRRQFNKRPPMGIEGADVGNGEAVFAQTCQACHGPAAVGVAGLGPALVANRFVSSLSDSELFEFVTMGRTANDPTNQSGLPMPPNGGNPSLTESDIADIVAFLRSLEG